MPRDDGVNKLALGLHTVAFVVNAWGLYLSATTPNMPGQHTWAGQFKFMTIWNVVFQVVFFGTSLLFDLTKHKSRKFMDQFFNAVVFPFAWTVVLLFWGLYAVDRDLIFPMSLDSIYPPYLNIQQVKRAFLLFSLCYLFVLTFSRKAHFGRRVCLPRSDDCAPQA
eukprot:TRINITY_DN2332_c0_g1_i2.p3 TRINITY_DN2332_c0_g1~~TRINITY_DN2332_c0_g1_i2.p3  ORF type:complete len:165 (-),score=3.27 TRINITY_DN2332_c0_g1_i2:270-764(-)